MRALPGVTTCVRCQEILESAQNGGWSNDDYGRYLAARLAALRVFWLRGGLWQALACPD
ncbi:hypothetical protein [Dentiradicibacter hellwigii]|uniref:Uncharacterized protein n=1 Tax=Dentiradicibacter hellwigii TaxID=3149053 RepID=A0ABV4UAX9_9RHOO